LYCADIEAADQGYYKQKTGVAKLWEKINGTFPIKYLANINRENSYDNYHSFFEDKTSYERKFKGFMVFNKPVYKSGDTVRLKASVTTKKGNPVNRQMILRLSGSDFFIDTILSTIAPYTRGGYEFSFVLNETKSPD
jgi:uncharacterized protein YfaS (alpha-2-macroglobulin family)